jgi:N-methylhydantoinase B
LPQAPGISGGYPSNTTYDVMYRGTSVRQGLTEGRIPRTLDQLDGELDLIPPELDTYVGWDDVYHVNWPGGGGYGDPLLRDPELVARDLAEGKITRRAALDVYGVVLDDGGAVAADATHARQLELRRERAGGGDVQEGRHGMDGRPFDDNVVIDAEGDSRCVHCGTLVGTASGPFLGEAHERLGDPALGGPQIRGNPSEFVDAEIVFRQLCCPGCLTALLTEIVPASETGVRLKALATD